MSPQPPKNEQAARRQEQIEQVAFRRLLFSSVVMPILLMSLAALLLLGLVAHLLRVNSWVRHTDAVLAQCAETRRLLSSCLSTHRGYLLLKDPDLLKIYQESRRAFPIAVVALQKLVVDNPPQIELSQGMERDAEELFKITDPLAEQLNPESEREAERISFRARTKFIQFMTEERELYNRRVNQEQKATAILSYTLVIGGTLGGLAMAFMLRRILGRLTKSYDGALSSAKMTAEMRERDRFFTLPSNLLCVADSSGYFRQLSVGWETTLGYTSEELLGRPYLEFVHPDDLPSTQEVVISSKNSVQPGFTNRYRHKNGGWVWLHWCSSAYLEGDLVYAVAVDVTQQHAAEEEVRRLNRELHENVAQLDALNKEMESFCYSVSHDLRSPLRAIDGFAQVLLGRHTAQLDEKGSLYLSRIRAGAQRMGDLIDDLLLLARVNRGQLEFSVVDLSAVSLEIMTDLRASEPARTVEFEFDEAMEVSGDPSLLRAVLSNLLENAWKYSSTEDRAKITFRQLEHARDSRVFCISDNGVGFDMTYADKLFVPFQRLHSALEFQGNGVGLATVQRALARHGGSVWAESTPGSGAKFFFTLGEE